MTRPGRPAQRAEASGARPRVGLLERASFRHLVRHPAQLGLSVLGVALGVAVYVSIALAIESARGGFRASAETVAGRATHHVFGGVGGIPEELLRTVRVELGVRASAPVVEGVVASPALPGLALRVVGIDPFSEAPFRPYLAGGAPGVDVGALITTPLGAVLAEETARAAGVRPGDTLAVVVDGRAERLPVVGVLVPDGRLASAGTRDLLVMDVASAQSLVGRSGRLSRIDLRLPGSDAAGAVEQAIRAVLPADARLEAAGARAKTLEGMIAAFDLNLTALSMLALMFGMFLIYNAQTFSVVQRRELFGGLRALGVTRRQILRLVLHEALWIGVAGTLLGLLGGIALGRGLVRMVTRTINDLYFVVSVEGVALPVHVLAVGAGLGVVATLLAALVPAREAASVPPGVAQARSDLETRARAGVVRAAWIGAGASTIGAALLLIPTTRLLPGFVGLFAGLVGMALLTPAGAVVLVGALRPLAERSSGLLGAMAARGVVTALSRTAPAIAALVVAVSVTVGMGVMIDSFRGTLLRWLDTTLQADLYVSAPSVQASRAAGTLPAEAVAALSAHPEVVGRSTYRATEVSTPGGPVRLVALDLDVRGERAFDFLQGRASEAFRAFRADRAVIVSEPFAYRRGVRVGDDVTLPAAGGPVSLPVAGVFRDFGSDQGVVMMSRATFDRAYDDPGVTSLALFLAPGADPAVVARQLGQALPEGVVLSIRTNRALREGSVDVFDRTFQVTAVLRLLAFVVAFVGVVSALTALQLERGRELGVLRAQGMTPRQVGGMVTLQTGLMGLVSGLMAVPVGLALAVVMIFVINRRGFGWTLQMEVGWTVPLQAIALALAGALIAGIVPAWRMARTSPAAALRAE